jgi:NAD-dependent histone deacetylase SIR2
MAVCRDVPSPSIFAGAYQIGTPLSPHTSFPFFFRNYTQNIDTLEQVAGITRVIQCHGSFSTASCLVCAYQVPASEIEADVKAKRIPVCPRAGTDVCPRSVEVATTMEVDPTKFPTESPPSFIGARIEGHTAFNGNASGTSNVLVDTADEQPETPQDDDDGATPGTENELPSSSWLGSLLPKPEPPLRPVMKPDIVFFGQDLPEEFYESIPKDAQACDLVIVIGSSLKVCHMLSLTLFVCCRMMGCCLASCPVDPTLRQSVAYCAV